MNRMKRKIFKENVGKLQSRPRSVGPYESLCDRVGDPSNLLFFHSDMPWLSKVLRVLFCRLLISSLLFVGESRENDNSIDSNTELLSIHKYNIYGA